MSAPGNSPGTAAATVAAGFTLLELMLVVAIIAMAGAGVGLALRDIGQTQLERESLRLIAMLESARARSRASGMPVYWRAGADGFEFVGLAPGRQPGGVADGGADGAAKGELQTTMPWLADGLSVSGATLLTLGPEPIIGRQEIVLHQADASLRIGTDGLRPFVALAVGEQGAGP